MAERPPITPELKVGQLLAAYPELEPVLMGLSPRYQALRNPLLRHTVAKVATLRQVAMVGGVGLGVLINRLREVAGQEAYDSEPGTSPGAVPTPDWVTPDRVVATLDARSILAGGGHPMQQVVAALDGLQPGQVFLLITPFVPEPLVDIAKKKGFDTHSEVSGPDLVRTYFLRPGAG